jgi:hypothetical protein
MTNYTNQAALRDTLGRKKTLDTEGNTLQLEYNSLASRLCLRQVGTWPLGLQQISDNECTRTLCNSTSHEKLHHPAAGFKMRRSRLDRLWRYREQTYQKHSQMSQYMV